MAKNRGHGEGSVYKLQSGKWAAAIVVGRDAAGKRRKKILYGDTKREVTEALTRLQNQKLDGVLQPTVKLTVSDMLNRWLTSWATGLENNTRLKYRQMADRFINPKLGGIQVERLTSLHIDSLLDSVRESGVGPRTSQYVFSTIRRALNMAMRRKLVVRNVCDGVEPPRADKQQVKAMSPEQVNGLLADVAGTRWEALFVLAITGGFRQGELFALTWDDVDLQAGTVTVRQSLEEINGVFKLKSPKSKSGIRRVAVPAMAVEALHAHRRLMMLEGRAAAATVFCNSIGGFISKQNFYNHTWKPIRARVGLEGFTFHSLRHASASLLLRSGIHPKVVQERLGHSDIAMTLGIYSHLLEGMDGGAADAMQSALKNAKSANGCKLATNGVSGDAANEKPADATRCASAG